MASIYARKDSTHYWINFRHPDTGERVNKKTEFRVDNPADNRRAQKLALEISAKEMEGKIQGEHPWQEWVPQWLRVQYGNTKTGQRYVLSWHNLTVFFKINSIHVPSALKREHLMNYMDWRTSKNPHESVFEVSHNTALFEIKVLHLIMEEAVLRGYVAVNPCMKLGIAKEKADEKPEMSDDEITAIREELKTGKWDEWMSTSFEIALHTGCRLRETMIPMHLIDLKNNRITFPHPKGGEARAFSIPIHPGLKPLLKKLKSDTERKFTCEIPYMASKPWWRLFKKLKMKHLCFHCLRVTFITRHARAGTDERVVMRLVNHASQTIHRVYQRLRSEDAVPHVTNLVLPKR